jgi:predicted hydrocarbon binding protein
MVANEQHISVACQFFLPNKLGRVLLVSLEDVMGRSRLNVILNQARLRHLINNFPPNNLDLGWSFEEMSALHQGLEEIHGVRAGQGVAIRAGRASLHYLQEDLGAVLGISDRPFRLLPLGTKLRAGLNALADLYNKTSDQVVRVEELEDRFLFHVDRCPICWGRAADVPICRMQVGLLEEALSWVSNGQNLAVEEVGCIAGGDPSCTYAVDKLPLG